MKEMRSSRNRTIKGVLKRERAKGDVTNGQVPCNHFLCLGGSNVLFYRKQREAVKKDAETALQNVRMEAQLNESPSDRAYAKAVVSWTVFSYSMVANLRVFSFSMVAGPSPPQGPQEAAKRK